MVNVVYGIPTSKLGGFLKYVVAGRRRGRRPRGRRRPLSPVRPSVPPSVTSEGRAADCRPVHINLLLRPTLPDC